ncbi:hypothetical protein [Herbaspirillum sp. B65]|uniref:hypothetical protein n=1 Tax=Herbaspirillum sp. B65 TaxID=137708 RepID=UPI0005C81F1F|nr:hypothetical protein [Herbaspirillum sp. B65]
MARLSAPLLALFLTAVLSFPLLPAQAASTQVRQPLPLSSTVPYTMAVYANADLAQLHSDVQRAVIVVHGVKRNAGDYFALGQHLLQRAQLTPANTLLLAPNFMARKDADLLPDMPIWGEDAWMEGEASIAGVSGISSFQALDDLLRWLAQPGRFPDLHEIVLIGHSAGAQLMQRYALLNGLTEDLQQGGIHLRYIISSPSSYLYLSPERPVDGNFAVPPSFGCPRYDDYRYGLGQPTAYLAQQHLDGRQLFARYAARDVRYLVGERDTDPYHRFLDRSCGAIRQGPTRLARQLAYLDYEQFLARQWQIPIKHPQQTIPDAEHGAPRLYRSPLALRLIFPELVESQSGQPEQR